MKNQNGMIFFILKGKHIFVKDLPPKNKKKTPFCPKTKRPLYFL